jgi:hypothetical protein
VVALGVVRAPVVLMLFAMPRMVAILLILMLAMLGRVVSLAPVVIAVIVVAQLQ